MEFPSPSSVRCHTGCTPAASQDGGDGGREVDEAGAVAEDHRKRRKKTHIKWKVYAQGKGWAQVLLFLRTIARTECDSCELGPWTPQEQQDYHRVHISVPLPRQTMVLRLARESMYRTQICFWGEVGIATSQRGGQSRGAPERFVCNQGPSRRQPVAQRSHCDLLSGCSSYVCCGCTRLSGDV
jgi:hypothetical protein